MLVFTSRSRYPYPGKVCAKLLCIVRVLRFSRASKLNAIYNMIIHGTSYRCFTAGICTPYYYRTTRYIQIHTTHAVAIQTTNYRVYIILSPEHATYLLPPIFYWCGSTAV